MIDLRPLTHNNFTDFTDFFLDIDMTDYNGDLQNIMTPVRADVLLQLLHESQYPDEETQFLYNGFTSGFQIGFTGDCNVRRFTPI